MQFAALEKSKEEGQARGMEKSSWKGENGSWAQELAANKVCMCFAVSLKCLVDEIIITRFITPSKCVWCHLGVRHTRLGVMKGWVAASRLAALKTLAIAMQLIWSLAPPFASI